ncbi:MAG: TadE/TadG family type IV pilus assembly protein [Hyphomicrobiaceae bacterium]
MKALQRRSVRRSGNGIIARLRRETGGMAAVEFAMIVPIMFFLFVGTIEFSQALTVDRRLTQAASSTADLIARAPNSGLTADQVDRDLKIIEQLIAPYELERLYVKVISVIAQGTPGNPSVLSYVVDWSRDNLAGTPHNHGDTYNQIPEGLLVAGESVIVSEATYNYTPLVFNYFIQSAFNMTERFFLKPRNSSCVHLRPINCVTGGTMS